MASKGRDFGSVAERGFVGVPVRGAYASPFGGITLAADDGGLIGLWFDGQRYYADVLRHAGLDVNEVTEVDEVPEEFGANEPHHTENDSTADLVPCPGGARAALASAVAWLDEYFAGRQPQTQVPVHFIGTPFRCEVWRVLQRIPYGRTITYGDIARELEAAHGDGRKVSARAVGGAVGHNPVSLIVPCHRVIGSTGRLIGYAGGVAVKTKLFALEGIDLDQFTIPAKGTAL